MCWPSARTSSGGWSANYLCFIPEESVVRTRTDDGTGNLRRHITTCDTTVQKGQTSIATYAQGSTYTKVKLHYLLGRWVACRNWPFVIIQDPELLDIFRMFNASVEVPHPTTLSCDVHEMFLITRVHLGSILQVCTVVVSHLRCANTQ